MSARGRIATLLILATGAMLALNLPGQLSYDSISQLYEGRIGAYDSWHPPVMAWLLGLFDALWPGPALFVIFDAGLLLGAWLILLSLGRRPGWTAGAVALVMLLTPQFLLYQGAVWKDILFADSGVAAFAALAAAAADWKDKRGLWLGLSALLLALAALTRQNGLLLLPVAALTLGWIATRQSGWYVGLAYAGGGLLLVAVLAGAGTWALSLRGDKGEGIGAEIRRAEAADLVGALKIAPGLALPLLDQSDPSLVRLMHDAVRLYSPVTSDTLEKSPGWTETVFDAPSGLLFAQWKNLVLDHPGLYLAERWPVFRWTLAAPDPALCHPAFAGIEGDPAQLAALDLAPRIRPQDAMLARYARALSGTPVMSHLTFAVLAVFSLAALLRRRRGPDIAMAGLMLGCLIFALSFFVISVACDYRYLYLLDLGSMTAAFYLAVSRFEEAVAPSRRRYKK